MMNKKLLLIFTVLAMAALLFASCTAKRETSGAKIEQDEAGYQWRLNEAENASGRTRDASITSAVKMKFVADDLIFSSRINVDTINGIVTLNGKVTKQEEIDRAVWLVRSVEGVRRVRSNLDLH